MGALGFIILGVIGWFLYNLFTKIIWPVYKATQHVKRQFKNMAQEKPSQPPPTQNQPPKKNVGEYIDFEELK